MFNKNEFLKRTYFMKIIFVCIDNIHTYISKYDYVKKKQILIGCLYKKNEIKNLPNCNAI